MWFKFKQPLTAPKREDIWLPFPPLLTELLKSGRWKQPPDERLQRVIAFLREPVEFVKFSGFEQSTAQLHVADDPRTSVMFHEYRGSQNPERNLPWLDAEKALFIAVNREPGADLGVALDYRTDRLNPRVVASDWWTNKHQCNWREVEARFSDFVEKLEL